MDKEAFGQSLSADEPAIIEYLPYLLQDLWSLGGRPELAINMLQGIQLKDPVVLDLGCGKGSSLIQIVAHLGGLGLGVDCVPAFINDATCRAQEWRVASQVTFRIEDLVDTIKKERDYDLVVYGMDSDVLGTHQECLSTLKSVLKPAGYLFLEIVYANTATNPSNETEKTFKSAVTTSGFRIVQEQIWSQDFVKKDNLENTQKIALRTMELIEKFPQKRAIFETYLQSQKTECKELETNYQCVSVLLQANDRQ